MKHSILFLSLLCTTLVLSSCNSSKKEKQTETAQSEVVTAYSVDDLLSQADSLVGQSISVEGVCTHICAHGGKKIFLMGTDDTKTIRVEATDQTGAFAQECVNSVVTATGKLVEQRIDEAYLAQWEADVKAGTDEKHGDDEEAAGCTAEQKAQNETAVNTIDARIANFRTRIAQQKEETGKDYLSFFHIEAQNYTIAE